MNEEIKDPKQKKKKFVFPKLSKKIVIGLVILVVVFATYKYFKSQNKYPDLKTEKVVKKDLLESVSASGKIEAEEEVSLTFQTSGKLAWVGVKEGDRVEQWQAIASLDKKTLEKTLKQELLDYMNERWDFEQATLDDYRDMALTETIRRVKEQAQFDLDRVVLDVEIADIALKYATLITPIPGIVTKIDTPFPGVNVTPISTEFVISNPDTIVFAAKVDEVDIGKIKAAQSATLILDAYPEEEFSGTISSIDFTSTSTSGGGTAYIVKFPLPPNTNEQKFKLGMNGDLEIFLTEVKNTLVIPFEALKQDGEPYVYVFIDGKPVKTSVKTGISSDFEVEITDGLNEGDEVITSGFKDIEG